MKEAECHPFDDAERREVLASFMEKDGTDQGPTVEWKSFFFPVVHNLPVT